MEEKEIILFATENIYHFDGTEIEVCCVYKECGDTLLDVLKKALNIITERS